MSCKLSFPEQVTQAIRAVVGVDSSVLHEPLFQGNEWNYLKECLDSTFVSSVGKFVDRFEQDLVSYTGAKHAVAVVNGTAALHIAIKLAGVTTEMQSNTATPLHILSTAKSARWVLMQPNSVNI